MYKYKPHSGKYYANIGDGSDKNQIDFVCISSDDIDSMIMILKHNLELAIYDFNELLNFKKNAKVLNYKEFSTSDLAYSKFMKWIGKMIKKSVSFDNKHLSRYYGNKQDKKYQKPKFINNSELMEPIYQWMEEYKDF